MEKINYKKVTILVGNSDDSVSIRCVRLKGDEELELGEQITVRGELKRRDSQLEFGNGCSFIKDIGGQIADPSVVSALRNLPEGEFYAEGFCALTGTVSVIERVQNVIPQRVTFLIGALSMFVAAVFYLLMSDLSFKNTADRLIISVLLAFGSAILFFLSVNFTEKPVAMWIFKGLGLALGVGFVIYLHIFQQSDTFEAILEVFRRKGISGESELLMSQVTMIVTLVLGYIAIAGQAANTVLVAVIKDK